MGKNRDTKSQHLWWIAFFGLVAFGLITAGIFYYRYEAQLILDDKYEDLAVIAKLKADSIQHWRKHRLADVKRTAVDPLVKKEIARLLHDPTNPSTKAALQILLNVNRKDTIYADALFLDIKGNILLSDNPNPAPVDQATIKAIRIALKDHKEELSDFFRDDPKGFIYIDTVAPIPDNSGQSIAIVVLRSKAAEFLYPLIQTWPTPSKTAETLLVRRDGDSVLFLNELRHRSNTALNLRVPIANKTLPAVQTVSGKYDRLYGKDYRGVDVLAIGKPILQSPWFIMTKIDEKEILADVRYKAWIITIIVALLILISAGIISLLYRNQREVERKQATESLRKSEENFRHLLDDSPLGVCIVTAKGETIYANKALLDIYGYANVEELNKIPIKERYTPQSYAEFCIRKKARDDGDFGPSEYEIDIVMKNKEIRHLQVLRKQIFWNGAMQFQVIYQDITERKLSEETLKQVKERLLLAIDAGGVGIWDLDIVNNKLFWDDQMFRLYGITPDNFSGAYETWKERVHPEDIERSDSEVQMALRGEKEFDTDFRVVWPNGTIHHIRARARVHRDAANQPTKLIGTNYDITERKLANLKLEKQNKELAFQNEEKEKRAAELVIVNKELEQEITARKQTEVELQQTLESLKKAISATIQAMVSAIEMRDPYTAGHQLRVADLACAIATEMGLSQEKIEGIRMAGSIHDIGKLSIPAEILSKPTKLTNLEFSMIKEHPQSGYDMLKDVKSPWPLAQIVYQHHERMDGTGYPRKLKGDEILLEARIMTVADVVEAMASHRPYRASLGIDVALTEIEKNRGIFYDNSVADACLRLFREKGYQLT